MILVGNEIYSYALEHTFICHSFNCRITAPKYENTQRKIVMLFKYCDTHQEALTSLFSHDTLGTTNLLSCKLKIEEIIIQLLICEVISATGDMRVN